MSDRGEVAKQIIGQVIKDVEEQKAAPLNFAKQAAQEFDTDIRLKNRYANFFIGILIGQLVLMNAFIFFHGFGFVTIDKLVLNIYMSGTLAEIFGIVTVITVHLFPRNRKTIYQILKE